MKTVTEINTEMRYWQGMLEGLKTGGGDPPKEKIVQVETTLHTLQWVLGEAGEVDKARAQMYSKKS
jgi:hypothetical protein